MYLFLTESAICFIFTVYLYFQYAAKGLPLYIPFLVISVWFMTFLTAFIVPFDIFTVTNNFNIDYQTTTGPNSIRTRQPPL
jgi:hypothetical protein